MEEINKKQLIIIRICCVIASFILWLYIFNIENPIRERKIVVPVKITNKDVLLQSKLVPVGEESLNITLRVKGNASDVYAIKASDFDIQSDVSTYVVKKGENRIPVEVKKSPDNIKIMNDDSLWIKIVLDDLKEKKVPVKVVLQGKPKEGFVSKEPVVSNRDIEVTGARDNVNKVVSVIGKYDISNASKDMDVNLELKPVDASGAVVKDVSIKPNSITAKIYIGKVKTVPINIKTIGSLPKGEAVKSLVAAPDSVQISGDGLALEKINSIDTETIDLSKLNGKDTIEIKLAVPDKITLVNNNGFVNIKIVINKGVQKEFSVAIKQINLKPEYSAVLDNDKVSVILLGAEEIINNLSADKIEASIDMGALAEGEHTVPINIKIPEGVSKASQNLTNVKVTITKKVVEGKNVNQNK